MSDLLAAALDYAARGLPVFPCVPRGKTPAVARGFHAATTNPATIRRYWTDPERNIGIPTGVSSGVWVLDIDGVEGEASLRALETKHGAIPKTRSVDHFSRSPCVVCISVSRFRRAPAGSVPALMCAVMAVT